MLAGFGCLAHVFHIFHSCFGGLALRLCGFGCCLGNLLMCLNLRIGCLLGLRGCLKTGFACRINRYRIVVGGSIGFNP